VAEEVERREVAGEWQMDQWFSIINYTFKSSEEKRDANEQRSGSNSSFLPIVFVRFLSSAPEFQSAESAIGFGGRLQRHHSTGLCSSRVVFDPTATARNSSHRSPEHVVSTL
jgi:hypothetical protein